MLLFPALLNIAVVLLLQSAKVLTVTSYNHVLLTDQFLVKQIDKVLKVKSLLCNEIAKIL